MSHFNQLTPAELERLAVLSEELGEAQQIIGKILRHGYDSYNPIHPEEGTNRQMLEKELGDVRYSMIALCAVGDLSKEAIHAHAKCKAENIKPWLHHQHTETEPEQITPRHARYPGEY